MPLLALHHGMGQHAVQFLPLTALGKEKWQRGNYRVRVKWNPKSWSSRPTAVAGWQTSGPSAVWRMRRAVSAQDLGPRHCQLGIFHSRRYCGGRAIVPASGRAGNRQAMGLLFYFCSAMGETVVPRSQKYLGALAAHSENPPVPSNKRTFSFSWWGLMGYAQLSFFSPT